MKDKLLLVTFAIDFGSKIIKERLIELFRPRVDLKVHEFVPQPIVPGQLPYSRMPYLRHVMKRVTYSRSLWTKVREAQAEGRQILFQSVSPSLFAYPATAGHSYNIITDWTRKLQELTAGKTLSPAWLTYLHKKPLCSANHIFGFSDAVIESLAKDYEVSPTRLHKVRMPFDLNQFSASPNRHDKKIKILFVGAEFRLKGGDVLLHWFSQQHNPDLQLTLVTRSVVDAPPGVKVEQNVRYGDEKHKSLFEDHDILVLPTKSDAFGMVLGEAACAGLAVLTTKHALGAPEVITNGVNGFIADSQENLMTELAQLVRNPTLINTMKRNSRAFMEKEFQNDQIYDDIASKIFSNSIELRMRRT